jgi:thiol-disulfide isomerase/thioredoxin
MTVFLFIPFFLGNSKFTTKDFTLSIYKQEKKISYKDLMGKKTLINFWASWCTSCIEEIPILHKLKTSKNSNEYNFIAINAGDSNKKIKKFIKRYKFNYTTLMDKDRSVSKSWGVTNLPITLVLDEKGKIIFQGIRPPKALP